MRSRKERNNNDDPQPSWEESEVSHWGTKRTMRMQRSQPSTDDRRFSKNLMTVRSYTSYANSLRTTDSFSVIHIPLTEITPQICLGSVEDARNEIELRERKITHIISLIGPYYLFEGIRHEHSPMNDNGKSDLKRVIESLWPFIQESQKPHNALFVHCMSGQNRSATLVIAILMKIKRKALRDAFRMVKKKRPIVQINALYAKQLTKLELELFGQNTVPKNWMVITSVNIESGSVVFCGGDLSSLSTERSANSAPNNNIKPQPDNMNVIHENLIQSRPYAFNMI